MKKTIALISRGWLSKDPRALFLARSFKKNGYKVIGINLDTPSDSGLNSPIFNEFECHNIEFDRSVAKDTYSLSKILLAHIDYKLSVYADRNLGKQTSYFVNYIRRKLNVIPVESSYELSYLDALIKDSRYRKLIDKVDILFGCEMFYGGFIAYHSSLMYNKQFVLDVKELYHDMDPDLPKKVKYFIKYYEKLFFDRAIALPCVSQGIINIYKNLYPNVRSKFVLLPNASDNSLFINHRQDFAIKKGKIKLILLATYVPKTRGIEFLLKIWEKLDTKNAILHIYLASLDQSAKNQLISYVTNTYSKSVFFMEPVIEDKIIEIMSNYDIGVVPYLPVCLNHVYCSPNKFGQYLKSGLAVLSTDTKNITQLIIDNDCGYVYPSEDLDQSVLVFKKAINERKKIYEKQNNSIKLFESQYNWNNYVQKLISFLDFNIYKIGNKKLRILIMHYVDEDKREKIPKTVLHNLDAFDKYSYHQIDYFYIGRLTEQDLDKVKFSEYDCLIMHYYAQVYSVFPSFLTKKIARFNGKKIFFAQDDYDHIERNRQKYKECKIDVLYSPIADQKVLNYLYPKKIMEKIIIKNYLTGYSNKIRPLESLAPIVSRPIDVFYRGNDVSWAYGTLGHEKQEIGISMKRYLSSKSFKIDIECDISKQIYSNDYFVRMANAKATLLTESGSSIVIDNDDYMVQKIQIIELSRNSNKLLKLSDLKTKFKDFLEHDGKYIASAISPKAFEAISCKTAIIAYNGYYSGVLIPNEHFIVLNRDYSNIDEVYEKLHDANFLQKMVDKTYSDIILSEKYTYKKFIQSFDKFLESYLYFN